jgi:ArsR family transcriptional regulator
MRQTLPVLPAVPNRERMSELATLLGAIAQEKRLMLVAMLAKEESCVCDLIDRLQCPQSLISYHLRALREAGLVRERRDSHWVYYSLVEEQVIKLGSVLQAILGDGHLPEAARYGANRRCE